MRSMTLIVHDWYPYKKRSFRQRQARKGGHEEVTGRRQPSISQGDKPQKKPAQLTLALTSGFQNHKKISFCCASHPVGGTSLWQP